MKYILPVLKIQYLDTTTRWKRETEEKKKQQKKLNKEEENKEERAKSTLHNAQQQNI